MNFSLESKKWTYYSFASRADFGDFYRIAEKGYWWSSTESPSTVFPEGEGIAINISYNSAGVVKYDMEKSYGKSIRCINDSPTSNITELNSNQPKELIKIVNLFGQEVEYTPNTVLIYQYSDGTSEKVFTIED